MFGFIIKILRYGLVPGWWVRSGWRWTDPALADWIFAETRVFFGIVDSNKLQGC
jgi:hypothetical protein